MRKRRAARCWRLPSLPTACLLPGHNGAVCTCFPRGPAQVAFHSVEVSLSFSRNHSYSFSRQTPSSFRDSWFTESLGNRIARPW